LHKFKLADLVDKKKTIITIDEKTTVEESLRLLQEHNILSVPVKDENGGIKGILNVFDLLIALVFQSCFAKFNSKRMSLVDLTESDLSKDIKTEIFNEPAASLLGLSQETAASVQFVYDAKTTLYEMTTPFSLGLHRVLVDLGDGQFSIVSQSDVVSLLYNNAKDFTSLVNKTIAELGLIKHLDDEKRLYTVPAESNALSAFRKLWSAVDTNLLALPIIDKQGFLVDTISASDLRGLNKSTFKNLLTNVLNFVAAARGEKTHKTITCVPTDSLLSVMEKVNKSRIHRVWVVKSETDLTPIGVVALTGVILKFSPFDMGKDL